MARDPRKHQQRQERRNRREKEKRKEQARTLSLTFSPMALLVAAGDPPFNFCGIHGYAFTNGMGNLVVSRQLPNGQCVAATFLVDLYCLGIKDVSIQLVSRYKFDHELVKQIFRSEPAEWLTPAEAKKLVLGAAEFAGRFGLQPHEDFARGLAIFRGVDETVAEREFVFGKDGKPFYINGPYDSHAFQTRVLHSLKRAAGPGGYDYLVMTDEIDDFENLDGVEIIDRQRDGWRDA